MCRTSLSVDRSRSSSSCATHCCQCVHSPHPITQDRRLRQLGSEQSLWHALALNRCGMTRNSCEAASVPPFLLHGCYHMVAATVCARCGIVPRWPIATAEHHGGDWRRLYRCAQSTIAHSLHPTGAFTSISQTTMLTLACCLRHACAGNARAYHGRSLVVWTASTRSLARLQGVARSFVSTAAHCQEQRLAHPAVQCDETSMA